MRASPIHRDDGASPREEARVSLALGSPVRSSYRGPPISWLTFAGEHVGYALDLTIRGRGVCVVRHTASAAPDLADFATWLSSDFWTWS
jgi:hypothetical protein